MVTDTIELVPGDEPTTGETGDGGDQDDAPTGDDDNGDMTIDFGFIPTQSIGSVVFYDVDNDGDQDLEDALEKGIEGVTLVLYADDGTGNFVPVDTTVTGPDGCYEFDSLPPGNYQVEIPSMPDDAPASSTPTDTGDTQNDELENGEQPGGSDTPVRSGTITLEDNEEQTGTQEPNPGGNKDEGTWSARQRWRHDS